MNSMTDNITDIVRGLEDTRELVAGIPRLSQERLRGLQWKTGGALGAARSLERQLAAQQDRIVRRINVDESVTRLCGLAAKEKDDAERHEGRPDSTVEWLVSVALGELYTSLALALQACRGRESDQPKDEAGNRKLSPEEMFEWHVSDAQREVFDLSYRAMSRSTSTSSNAAAQAKACAAAMFLAAVGQSPLRHYAYDEGAVRWTETITEEVAS